MKSRLFLLFLFVLPFASISSQEINHEQRQNNFVQIIGDDAALIYASDRKGNLNKDYYYLTGDTNKQNTILFSKDAIIHFKEDGEKSLRQFYREISSFHRENQLWISFSNLQTYDDLLYFFSSKPALSNTDLVFYQLRDIKDKVEQEVITKSVAISAESYNHIFRTLNPGMTENEIIDQFKKIQIELEAESTSFFQAGSGVNGTQVHADPSDKIVKPYDMIVFDVGVWYKKCTSDISRTVPANGTIDKYQKQIYTIVLEAQKAGIKDMKVGAIMGDVQQIVEDKLID